MNSSFFNILNISFISVIIVVFFICIFFIPFLPFNISLDESLNINNDDDEIIKLDYNSFLWPTPGFNRITSKFGKRVAPAKRFLYLS